MKTLLTTLAVSCLFVLCSCKAIMSPPPITKREADVLLAPIEAKIVTDVVTKIPIDVTVTTTKSEEVTLAEETKVCVPLQNDVTLPKDTVVILPTNTPIKVISSVPVIVPKDTLVLFPTGTAIMTDKINWYAILFYLTLVVIIGVYYLSLRKPTKQTKKR